MNFREILFIASLLGRSGPVKSGKKHLEAEILPADPKAAKLYEFDSSQATPSSPEAALKGRYSEETGIVVPIGGRIFGDEKTPFPLRGR